MTKAVRELLLALCRGKASDRKVFTRDGVPVADFRDSWKRATANAGCPTLMFHDLRRTGVRNLRRMGIGEHLAMRISGHKTQSVFRRYDIVSEEDLRQVAMMMDKGHQSQEPEGKGHQEGHHEEAPLLTTQ
jgi:integrase